MFANYTAWGKWRLEEGNHDPASELARGLRSITRSFSHTSHVPIWPRCFTSNRHRYGNGRAAMRRSLRRARTLRLDLCDCIRSCGQLACAWAREPDEVHMFALIIMSFHRYVQVMSTALKVQFLHFTMILAWLVATWSTQCTTRNTFKVTETVPQLCRKSARLSPAPQTSNS